MPLYVLEKDLVFPHYSHADTDGLLALGGDLSPERLLLAYKNGIFPWYEGDIILWWHPDPRFVIFPEELKINKTTRSLLNKNAFEFTINKSFPEVIRHCKKMNRQGQDGTWITDEMEKAFLKMHELGFAHSAEVWKNGELAGGLYGIKIGKVFFGESMFSLTSNASRYAFIRYVQQLKEQEGIELIDCQVYTDYIESMGGRMISGKEFNQYLDKWIPR